MESEGGGVTVAFTDNELPPLARRIVLSPMTVRVKLGILLRPYRKQQRAGMRW